MAGWCATSVSASTGVGDVGAYGYDFSGLSDVASRETAVRGMLAEKETLMVLDDVVDANLSRLIVLSSLSQSLLPSWLRQSHGFGLLLAPIS
jgi:hypothetical protein